MSLDASLVPETLLNAQRIMALPENPDHLPAVDWKNLGAPDSRIPHTETATNHQPDSPLPKADVVVMTWTLAEWAAMNQVLTNRRDPLTPDQLHSHEWQEGWLSYQRDYYQIYQYMVDVSKTFQGGAPSLYNESWGSFRQVRIGDLNVLLVKSGMHLAQDGSQLPLIRFVEQICQEARPSLLLSIGTGGGVRSDPTDHLALERARIQSALAGHDQVCPRHRLVECHLLRDQVHAVDQFGSDGGKAARQTPGGPGPGQVPHGHAVLLLVHLDESLESAAEHPDLGGTGTLLRAEDLGGFHEAGPYVAGDQQLHTPESGRRSHRGERPQASVGGGRATQPDDQPTGPLLDGIQDQLTGASGGGVQRPVIG